MGLLHYLTFCSSVHLFELSIQNTEAKKNEKTLSRALAKRLWKQFHESLTD